MNRTKKFRAWDKKWKRMIYFSLFDLVCDEQTGNLHSEFDDYQFPCGRLPKEYIYQDWTGLKDENNIEIYEGDIVECQEMHDSNIYSNAWKQNKEGKTIPNPLEIKKDKEEIDWDWFDDIRYHSNWWEVIGNIYENKDLLK